MTAAADRAGIPLLWINLDRQARRRRRMQWAIAAGGWRAHRLAAVDARQARPLLLPLPDPTDPGTALPGLLRADEPSPRRRTSRAELACLASWKRLLLQAESIPSPSGWVLLMEDDVGASLAVPQHWAHSLSQLIESCPPATAAIQLAPISGAARRRLHGQWLASGGHCLSLPKEDVRSHGNGAVLLRQRAIARLVGPLQRFTARHRPHWHPLSHPWRIRPLADKWLYGRLPPGSCRVATYPHFCLEALDSDLHGRHVEDFHRPSRMLTLELWRQDGRGALLAAQATWDSLDAP